jgi:hypothetical protein
MNVTLVLALLLSVFVLGCESLSRYCNARHDSSLCAAKKKPKGAAKTSEAPRVTADSNVSVK